MNLIDFFDRSAAAHPERPVLVFEGRAWTYRETSDLATRTAHGLKTFGVERETKCAVLGRNDPLAFGALLGILKARGTWVPLNAANAPEENLYIVEFFDAEVLFYEKEFEPFARLVKERVPAVRHFVRLEELADWAKLQLSEPIRTPWDPQAMCMLRGTGGTTGRPKGVMNTNRNFETNIAVFLSCTHFDAPPVYLACTPMTHAAGVLSFVTIAAGGTVVIQRKFDPQETLAAIARHGVSVLMLPPTAIYTALLQPNVRDFDYSPLRYFFYGGAPMSAKKLREAIEVFGPVMTHSYGQTEAPTCVTFMGPSEHVDERGGIVERRLLSCGRPSPFVRVELMDDKGELVPPGQVGEIVVQGGLVMKGYYKNPQATAEASRHGWHHTGDLAYRDEEGYLYLCDRKNEVIITGGFNVYPLEVEQVLMGHDCVQNCAVVGVPDARWGEAVKAVVELKPGRSVSAEELIALCKQRVGSVKAPKSVDFVDSLPVTALGKVLRRDVRNRYWTGRERQI
ncbi:MAG: long-chain fatty acid--CoA ligase [Betaproteobacteria bacterium]|nr:MAG: long-chain fatty acid--CoA ligase [Betaproteobacteria bacterium]